jgi:hypothetical protein
MICAAMVGAHAVHPRWGDHAKDDGDDDDGLLLSLKEVGEHRCLTHTHDSLS